MKVNLNKALFDQIRVNPDSHTKKYGKSKVFEFGLSGNSAQTPKLVIPEDSFMSSMLLNA